MSANDDWNWERDPYEDEYPMAERLLRAKAFDPVARPADEKILRAIMNDVRYWRHCRKPGCRRARKCVDAKVECAWRKLPYLQRTVIPAFLKMKAARLAALDDQETAALPPKPY